MSSCQATMLVPMFRSRQEGWTAPEQVARTTDCSVTWTRT